MSLQNQSNTDDDIPERQLSDDIEVLYLIIITATATVLNTIVLMRLLTSSKQPTVRTSFSTGPYQTNSFSLFKLHLCISDFFILLIYSLGKIIWLVTYDWRFGDSGCKLYQFLSALSFYANSNIIVCIGLDRLKCVYTRHIQGAKSVRRVRLMLSCSWFLAALFSLPQVFVWRTYSVKNNWEQCVTIFAFHAYTKSSSAELNQLALVYELSHQAAVFWLPFLLILFSYIMIVIKIVLHHTLRSKQVKIAKSSTDSERDSLPREDMAMLRKISSMTAAYVMDKVTGEHKKNHMNGNLMRTRSIPTWRRQLRSRVFRCALLVVLAHVAMWLPYNCISTMRFFHFEAYNFMMRYGGNFFEDFIVLNSLINPMLYGNILLSTRR